MKTIDKFVLTIPEEPIAVEFDRQGMPDIYVPDPVQFKIEIFEKNGVLYIREESKLGVKEVHFDEYKDRLIRQLDYNQIPEGRLIFLDNEFSQSILLSNFLSIVFGLSRMAQPSS